MLTGIKCRFLAPITTQPHIHNETSSVILSQNTWILQSSSTCCNLNQNVAKSKLEVLETQPIVKISGAVYQPVIFGYLSDILPLHFISWHHVEFGQMRWKYMSFELINLTNTKLRTGTSCNGFVVSVGFEKYLKDILSPLQ